jgi:hypothetical protein
MFCLYLLTLNYIYIFLNLQICSMKFKVISARGFTDVTHQKLSSRIVRFDGGISRRKNGKGSREYLIY